MGLSNITCGADIELYLRYSRYRLAAAVGLSNITCGADIELYLSTSAGFNRRGEGLMWHNQRTNQRTTMLSTGEGSVTWLF
ncbi:hypothetical protein J6590_036119 [Homalodisca vitripennis]|nr:hypothetical protein J6590_036119 [Homalodisca vitripennis]